MNLSDKICEILASFADGYSTNWGVTPADDSVKEAQKAILTAIDEALPTKSSLKGMFADGREFHEFARGYNACLDEVRKVLKGVGDGRSDNSGQTTN